MAITVIPNELREISTKNAKKILEDILEKDITIKKGSLIVFDMELTGAERARIPADAEFITRITTETFMKYDNKELAKIRIEQVKNEMSGSHSKVFEKMDEESKNYMALKIIDNMLETKTFSI